MSDSNTYYETMTSPFESHNGDLTLTYAVGLNATFDDMVLDTYADGVKVGEPCKGVAAIMENLIAVAPLAPAAQNMIESMTSRWPGLRCYLPKEA